MNKERTGTISGRFWLWVMTRAQFGTLHGDWRLEAAIIPHSGTGRRCRYTVAAGILPASERGFQSRDSSDMMRTTEGSLIARSLKMGLAFPLDCRCL
jgi:hypothetical protein